MEALRGLCMIPALRPAGARVSTTRVPVSYLGGAGFLLGNPRSRGWVRGMVRQELRVAKTPVEKRRVMDVWRHVHYLGRGKGGVFPPKTIRIHYYLDLPALRPLPHTWVPAAAVTIRYALLTGGGSGWRDRLVDLGMESPMQALEIARSFVADDLRYPAINDLSPSILREVVRRMRTGTEWQEIVAGRVQWRPVWLLSYSDPAVGHDGGVYRGAGAEFLGETSAKKQLWGWRL